MSAGLLLVVLALKKDEKKKVDIMINNWREQGSSKNNMSRLVSICVDSLINNIINIVEFSGGIDIEHSRKSVNNESHCYIQ